MENNTIESLGQEEDQFVKELAQVYKRLRFSKNLRKAMKEVESTLLDLLGARLFTIYQTVSNGKEIIASFKGGIGSENDIEIRVPLSPTSLAGYVALSQRPIVISNVYDQDELTNIHPRLQWDKRFSESKGLYFKSMIVVPIKDEILLGVLQVIRLKEDPEFSKADLKHAAMLSQMLAKQFRAELDRKSVV